MIHQGTLAVFNPQAAARISPLRRGSLGFEDQEEAEPPDIEELEVIFEGTQDISSGELQSHICDFLRHHLGKTQGLLDLVHSPFGQFVVIAGQNKSNAAVLALEAHLHATEGLIAGLDCEGIGH